MAAPITTSFELVPMPPLDQNEKWQKVKVTAEQLAQVGVVNIWHKATTVIPHRAITTQCCVQVEVLQPPVQINIRPTHLKASMSQPQRYVNRLWLTIFNEMLQAALSRYGSILHSQSGRDRSTAKPIRDLYKKLNDVLSNVIYDRNLTIAEEVRMLQEFQRELPTLVQEAEVILVDRVERERGVVNPNFPIIPTTPEAYMKQVGVYRALMQCDAKGIWLAPEGMQHRQARRQARREPEAEEEEAPAKKPKIARPSLVRSAAALTAPAPIPAAMSMSELAAWAASAHAVTVQANATLAAIQAAIAKATVPAEPVAAPAPAPVAAPAPAVTEPAPAPPAPVPVPVTVPTSSLDDLKLSPIFKPRESPLKYYPPLASIFDSPINKAIPSLQPVSLFSFQHEPKIFKLDLDDNFDLA
jgi:hypothetical protein